MFSKHIIPTVVYLAGVLEEQLSPTPDGLIKKNLCNSRIYISVIYIYNFNWIDGLINNFGKLEKNFEVRTSFLFSLL